MIPDALKQTANLFDISLFNFILILLWSFFWKMIALWRAANLQQKYWFVALFLINTMGILEIIYIFFIAKKYQVEIIE